MCSLLYTIWTYTDMWWSQYPICSDSSLIHRCNRIRIQLYFSTYEPLCKIEDHVHIFTIMRKTAFFKCYLIYIHTSIVHKYVNSYMEDMVSFPYRYVMKLPENIYNLSYEMWIWSTLLLKRSCDVFCISIPIIFVVWSMYAMSNGGMFHLLWVYLLRMIFAIYIYLNKLLFFLGLKLHFRKTELNFYVSVGRLHTTPRNAENDRTCDHTYYARKYFLYMVLFFFHQLILCIYFFISSRMCTRKSIYKHKIMKVSDSEAMRESFLLCYIMHNFTLFIQSTKKKEWWYSHSYYKCLVT